MRKLSVFAFVVLLFFVSVSAWAQGSTSRVVGVVSDASGAVVPAAKVTLANEATGVSFKTETTAAGTYVFEAVQVGSYRIEVEAAGFKKFTATGNRLSIGVPLTINVTLQVGAVAETVEVSGAAEIVQTSTSGNFGTLVEQRSVQDLPIVGGRGRNPLDLVNYQPGVVSGANTGGGVHVHGARDRAWNYTLDGIDTNETSAGGSNFSPLRANPDSLAEFRLITSNATAEFGRNSGAQVAMVTRSGSNDFHGTAFEFYRTPSFNANEWENNANKVGKKQYVQHMPGFEVGGPVRIPGLYNGKNRTFFFTNIQWLRGYQSRIQTNSVYTAEARKGNWRYVKAERNQPFGVPGSRIDSNGNVLPGANIGTYSIVDNDPQRLGLDPTIQKLIQMTPLPNNFSTGDGLNVAGFTFSAPEHEKQHDVVFKIDHVFNQRNFLYARVAWGRQDTLCDSVNGGLAYFPGLQCQVNTTRAPRNLAFNWRWNPTSRITNELVVGGNNFTFGFNQPWADASKLTLWAADVLLPAEYEFGNERTINTYQFVENLSYVHGAHNFKMGANLRYQQGLDNRGSIAGWDAMPTADFSTGINTVDPVAFRLPADINVTYDRGPLQTGINTLLGRLGTIGQGFVAQGSSWAPGGTLWQFDARYPEYDFYWQDNWKVKKNLTVDAGLRWELKLTPRNPDGLLRHPSQPIVAGAAPSNTINWVSGSLYNSDRNNVGPSLGVAWDPTGKGKQSIRANYRLAYDRLNTFVMSSTVYNSMPGLTYGVTNTDFGQSGGRLRDFKLSMLVPSIKPSDLVLPAAFSSSTQTVIDPSFHAPKTNMWGLSYQREVMRNTIVELDYIGRHAVNLYGAYNANQALYQKNGFLQAFNTVKAGGESDLMNRLLAVDSRLRAGETGSQMVHRLYQSTLDLNSVAALASAIGTRLQGGRSIPDLAGFGPFFIIPFPQYATMRVIDSNDFSTYNALELKLERRFSRGLGFMFAYTLAKSLDDRSFDPAFTLVSTANSQSASSTPFDIYNRKLNYARSDFDRTHVFQGTWVYELPFGRGKRLLNTAGVLDRIVGGWEVSGFITRTTGRPFTVYSGAYSFNSIVQSPANCNGCSRSDGKVFDDTGYRWFLDKTTRDKFSAPAAGTQGNSGRNMLDGPPQFDIDMALLKRTRINERQSIEYRADFTNFTNTPYFGFPTATITSTLFGRIGTSVVSYSRKMQMGLKWRF
jgi:hypothetical protein